MCYKYNSSIRIIRMLILAGSTSCNTDEWQFKECGDKKKKSLKHLSLTQIDNVWKRNLIEMVN